MKRTYFTRALSLFLALLLLGGSAVYAVESPTGVAAEENELPVVAADEREAQSEPTAESAAAADELPVEDEAAAESLPQTPADNELPVIPIPSDGGDTEKPVSEMTDAEIIALYSIPDNWARNALVFVVRAGLMSGKGGNNLAPRDYTTRAEVATMLINVLQTKAEADLSRFTDIKGGEWYYHFMARAVAAGIFGGSDNKMLPRNNITREQAFVVLAAMFGIYSSDYEKVYSYQDAHTVSKWAMAAMAGMVNAGYVSGTGNKLNPKKTITRQELAQVLYVLINGLGTEIPYIYNGSYALAADELTPGTTVTGNLLLSNEVSTLTLSNIRVDGRLTIQGVGPLTLTLNNCRIGTLAICRPTTLTISGGSVTAVETMQPSAVVGSFGTLNVRADTELHGFVSKANLVSGKLTVGADASISTLTVDGGSAENNGTIGTAEIYAAGFHLGGNGSVRRLAVYKKNVTTSNTVGTRDDSQIDQGLSSVTIARLDNTQPTNEAPKFTMVVAFSGFGTYPRTRRFNVEWRINDKLVGTAYNLKMGEGVLSSCVLDFASLIKAGEPSAKVTLTLVYEGEKMSFSSNIALPKPPVPDTSMVRTQNVQARMVANAALYKNFNATTLQFSGATGKTVSTGTQVTLLYVSKTTGAKLRLTDGTEGWVAYNSVKPIDGNYYTTQHYSTEVKEYYVNKVRNWSSSTNYLIWVSLWTQEVCVFTGSQGKWKLLRSDPCCSGANECPTPVESVTILYKQPYWYYTEYYVHSVSVFDATRGFHSWPIKNGTTNQVYDDAMGRPNSNSCIRMMDEAVTWIYDNIPEGTAVEIY